ncbi:MAG: hypothetical protein ACJAWV_003385, partial [Flammeovirgaceae bacterium]
MNEGENDYFISDEYIIEFELGWVFPWTSKKYVETGELQYALAGNAPLLVDKLTHEIHNTGTALDTEYYIEEYLIENYGDNMSWEVKIRPSDSLDKQKAVWINSIKSVFDYNSKEALSFITELPCVKLSEANKLEELK